MYAAVRSPEKGFGGGGGEGKVGFIIFIHSLFSAYSLVGPVDRTDLAFSLLSQEIYQNRSQCPPTLDDEITVPDFAPTALCAVCYV